MSRTRNGWVLPVSVLLALLLGLVPLPDTLQAIRPYWLALVMAYWVLEEPERMGLGTAFVLGLGRPVEVVAFSGPGSLGFSAHQGRSLAKWALAEGAKSNTRVQWVCVSPSCGTVSPCPM